MWFLIAVRYSKCLINTRLRVRFPSLATSNAIANIITFLIFSFFLYARGTAYDFRNRRDYKRSYSFPSGTKKFILEDFIWFQISLETRSQRGALECQSLTGGIYPVTKNYIFYFQYFLYVLLERLSVISDIVISSDGRALPYDGIGRRFESYITSQTKITFLLLSGKVLRAALSI